MMTPEEMLGSVTEYGESGANDYDEEVGENGGKFGFRITGLKQHRPILTVTFQPVLPEPVGGSSYGPMQKCRWQLVPLPEEG